MVNLSLTMFSGGKRRNCQRRDSRLTAEKTLPDLTVHDLKHSPFGPMLYTMCFIIFEMLTVTFMEFENCLWIIDIFINADMILLDL